MTRAAYKFTAGRPDVILGTGDSLSVVHGRTANVCAFGASPNASAAANTAAIQAGGEYINALGGGVVYFPAGTYDITVPSIRFNNFRNVVFEGEGRYSTIIRDPQGRCPDSGIYPNTFGAASGTRGFFTFADSTGIRFRKLGFQGSGTFVQADLGRDAMDRICIFFKSVSTGCSDCSIEDCYFTLIEGEVVTWDNSAPGPMRRMHFNRNHCYRNLANVLNPGGPADTSIDCVAEDNIMDGFGNSAFLLSGAINYSFRRNRIMMESGLVFGGACIILDRSNGVSIEDNLFYNFNFFAGTAVVQLGQTAAAGDVKKISVARNRFNQCRVLGVDAGGQDCAIIHVACGAAASSYQLFYIGYNEFVECGNTAAPYAGYTGSVAIRFSGARPIDAVVEGNRIFNNGVATPLVTGLDIVSTVSAGNGIVIRQNDFSGVVTNPYRFGTAPSSDQTYVSGSKTWDPPNVNNGAETTTTVTVTGAALGDIVGVGFSVSLAGMKLTGYVSAANTVTVVLRNDTGGALDLGSGTLRARCFKS